MVCAYEDRHMYECGCASGHCCAGRTAECLCVCVWAPEWSVINAILPHPWCASKPKDFALACVLFRPPHRRTYTYFYLPSQKHININIHTHAHTFANTPTHLAFWLACTQPSGQLDSQITHTHTKCRLSQRRLSVGLISSLALLSTASARTRASLYQRLWRRWMTVLPPTLKPSSALWRQF